MVVQFAPKPLITELHVDYIVYLVSIKQVSPQMARAAEIIATSRCEASVAEDMIETLKGLRMVGAERPVRGTNYGLRADDRAAREAALAKRGVSFK